MSYYKIRPRNSYQIIRRCPTCGGKTYYVNTNHFRVNGSLVDVWLIYQCEQCKHTCNLTIEERVNPQAIPRNQYEKFLANDLELCHSYGTNRSIFVRNKAEIAEDKMEVELVKVEEEENSEIIIENLNHIKVRADKLLAEILKLSRSQVHQKLKEGSIVMVKENGGNKIKFLLQ